VRLVPSGGGVFEVRNGQELLYSKRQLGRFPTEGEVLALVQALP
jgi:selenoprotein W-related protein